MVGADGEQLGVMDTQAAMRMASQLDLDLVEVAPKMKMRPKIDPHDYQTKKGHVERFLKQGHKVKVTIMFRGREMAHTELGRRLLERLAADLVEIAQVDSPARQDGRNMITVFSPRKTQGGKGAPPAAGRGQPAGTPAPDREAASGGRPAPVRTP